VRLIKTTSAAAPTSPSFIVEATHASASAAVVRLSLVQLGLLLHSLLSLTQDRELGLAVLQQVHYLVDFVRSLLHLGLDVLVSRHHL